MTIYEIVTRLIGEIHPLGESHTDKNRLENLKAMTELVNELVVAIDNVACEKDRCEYSIKLAGEFAHNFLTKDLRIKE